MKNDKIIFFSATSILYDSPQKLETFCQYIQSVFDTNFGHFLPTFDGWNLLTNLEKFCPSVQCCFNMKIGDILPVDLKPFRHEIQTYFAHFWRLEFVNESRELLLKCLWMIHQEIRTHFVHFATKIWDELPWNSETLRPLWWFHILTWNLKSIRSRHVETIFLKENK